MSVTCSTLVGPSVMTLTDNIPDPGRSFCRLIRISGGSTLLLPVLFPNEGPRMASPPASKGWNFKINSIFKENGFQNDHWFGHTTQIVNPILTEILCCGIWSKFLLHCLVSDLHRCSILIKYAHATKSTSNAICSQAISKRQCVLTEMLPSEVCGGPNKDHDFVGHLCY